MVFYRKYRPQSITELDLSEVRKKLESILKSKEFPHAFLFTGPKGLGKTSAARILAKAINCQNKKTDDIEPCNKCDICESITKGSNIDVLEIDAASNRGIDEIRELRERIKFAPAALSKKVYIIDEVHMLTTDAFNALLKTIEEPPSHAVFILCTTEIEKVPPTITSRTFHVKFNKPSVEEALNSLERIVKGEKLVIEKDVLKSIYSLADGSFRDAAKILEELSIDAGGKKITRETLDAIYKTGNIEASANQIIDALASNDAKTALSIIGKMAEAGSDFKVLTEKIASRLHDLILAKIGVSENGETDLTTEKLNELLEMVNESYKEIRFSVLPQIPLEIVVVEWCFAKKAEFSEAISEVIRKEEEKEEVDKSGEKKDLQESDEEDNETGMFSKNAISENFFQALLDKIKQDNHSIAGILRGCRLVRLTEDKAIFETNYKFHHDKLNDSKAAAILDKRATELLNRSMHVAVEMVAK